MDADFLRLLLFLAGVVLILGIYFWDRHKRVNVKVHAIRKAQREGDADIDSEPEIADDAELEARDEPTLDARQMAEQVAHSISDPANRYEPDALLAEAIESDELFSPTTPLVKEESDGDVEEALEQLDAMVQEEGAGTPIGEQGSFSFTADAPEDLSDSLDSGKLPVKILQLNVVARNGPFSGTDIAKAVLICR